MAQCVMWRKAGAIAGILFLVLIAYRVLGVYDFRPGACAAGPARPFAPTFPHRLTVMTFNIEGHAELLRGADHIERIAETINRHHPDVVCINEAHRHTWQARFDDQVDRLHRLTGMNAAFGKSYRFMGGDFGNAVLTRGAIIGSDVHRLPGVGEPRSILETVTRVNGGVVSVFVAHTSAWSSLQKSARGLQMECIPSHIRSSAYPFVLAGDFNAPPDSSEIATFLKSNPVQFTGDPKESSHKVMGQRLDYILASSGWKVVRSTVLDEGPSDHRPVLTELAH